MALSNSRSNNHAVVVAAVVPCHTHCHHCYLTGYSGARRVIMVVLAYSAALVVLVVVELDYLITFKINYLFLNLVAVASGALGTVRRRLDVVSPRHNSVHRLPAPSVAHCRRVTVSAVANSALAPPVAVYSPFDCRQLRNAARMIRRPSFPYYFFSKFFLKLFRNIYYP